MFWVIITLVAVIIAREGRHNGRRLYFGDVAVRSRRSRFVRALSSSGFLVTGTYPEETYLVGRWCGLENTRVRVRCDADERDVREVIASVDVPARSLDIRRTYETVSAALRREYGAEGEIGREGVCGLRTREWTSPGGVIRVGVIRKDGRTMVAARYIVTDMNNA